MIESPSPTVVNGKTSGSTSGRSANGRFTADNRFARGNPHNRQAQVLRSAAFEAVTADDARAIMQALVKKAKAGDVVAARKLLDRVMGKPKQAVELEAEMTAAESIQAQMAKLSDLELAMMIHESGAPLPTILQRKVDRVLEAQRVAEQAEAKPSPSRRRNAAGPKRATTKRKRGS